MHFKITSHPSANETNEKIVPLSPGLLKKSNKKTGTPPLPAQVDQLLGSIAIIGIAHYPCAVQFVMRPGLSLNGVTGGTPWHRGAAAIVRGERAVSIGTGPPETVDYPCFFKGLVYGAVKQICPGVAY